MRWSPFGGGPVRPRWFAGAVLIAVILVTAAASTNSTRVVGNCTSSQVRPSQVVLACADANALLAHLRWTSFGGASARATGDYSYNTCTPNCASGHFVSYPVTIVFSKAKSCQDGHRDYQLADAAYSSTRRPSGAAGAAGKPGS